MHFCLVNVGLQTFASLAKVHAQHGRVLQGPMLAENIYKATKGIYI